MGPPLGSGNPALKIVPLCLVQLALLFYTYSDPDSRMLSGLSYGIALAGSSGLLMFYAYQAFREGRPAWGLMAGLLAFPGFLLLLVAMLFMY